MNQPRYVVRLHQVGMSDIDSVGGKNASLGEMIGALSKAGIAVPGGFATTAHAYEEFLLHGNLKGRIQERIASLDVENVEALARAGADIRSWILQAPLPENLAQEIETAYAELMEGGNASVAVRSSATAEDMPDASFAGQQETFLNIHGLPNVLEAIRHVFASLYNDRAISYRVHKGYADRAVALSAGVQRMVRSGSGASGVLFTLDTESGFQDVIFITASWGLGEMVVQGAVNPDEFYVYKSALRSGKYPILRKSLGSKLQKMVFAENQSAGQSVKTIEVAQFDRNRFCLEDGDVIALAEMAAKVEAHYQRPMDIEWAKDGVDGKLYLLQARPETVKSRKTETQERYQLKEQSNVLASGRAIGQKIGAGVVRIVKDASEMARVQVGDVLVTDMTDPNWEPVMKVAAA
ncbi:MAG: PEP/pyruvate-binding domain-containing protein, partial [Burkholderiales bacterium]